MDKVPSRELETKTMEISDEEFEKLASQAETYAIAASKILDKTKHQLNLTIKESLWASYFATPVYTEDGVYGIAMHGEGSYDQKRRSVGVSIVEPSLHSEWHERYFGESKLAAIYVENYRTVFIRSDVDFPDEVKGLILVHELLHAVRHKQRDYSEIEFSDPRHAEEEVETLEYEIELAKQAVPTFSLTLKQLQNSMAGGTQITEDKKRIDISGLDKTIIDNVSNSETDDKMVLGTLLRCAAVFEIIEREFGEDSLGAKADYIEQFGYAHLKL